MSTLEWKDEIILTEECNNFPKTPPPEIVDLGIFDGVLIEKIKNILKNIKR